MNAAEPAFAADAATVAQAEAACAAAEPTPEQLATLAWHLRQRDPTRARLLLDAADTRDTRASTAAEGLRPRLHLVRAELLWLDARLEEAENAIRAAQTTANAVQQADGCMLLALIAFDRGAHVAAVQHLRSAQAHARAAGDTTRVRLTRASRGMWAVIGNLDAAERIWLPFMARLLEAPEPVLAMRANEFMGQLHRRRARHAQAVTAYERAFHLAQQMGQMRSAIVLCANLAGNCDTLNDQHAALEWVERGLALARPVGWPACLGPCLLLLGRTLSHLNQLAPARRALEEAQQVLQPLAGSRTAIIALFHAGELAQQMGDHTTAARNLAQVVVDSARARLPDLSQAGRMGLARALVASGSHAQALQVAEEALHLAREHRSAAAEFDALWALADVLAATPGAAPELSLQRALEAMRVAADIEQMIVPPRTWDDLARAHARVGDMASGYAATLQAAKARERVREKEAQSRAVLLATNEDIERTRAQRVRLQAQWAAEGERTAVLQSTNAALQQLGLVGREITAQRDVDSIFKRIAVHLQALIGVQHLSIWLLSDPPDTLHLRFGVEEGRQLPPMAVALSSDFSNAARCVREQCEILHHSPADVADPSQIPDTLRTMTALFGPLVVRGRVIGVLSVQSAQPQAYGQRERLVFRSLCTHGAIALDNARAYAELALARQRLQDASLGERQARQQAQRATQRKNQLLSHIAGVLDAPLSALHQTLVDLQSLQDLPNLQRTQMPHPAAPGGAAPSRLANALQQSHAVDVLASQLLDLARLEAGAIEFMPEAFSLAELLQDVMHKLQHAARRRRVELQLRADVPEGDTQVHADIGMVERVLTTLLEHALQRTPDAGTVSLALRVQPGQVDIQITDGDRGLQQAQDAGWAYLAPGAATQPPAAGLALAIARQMLHRHGQDITLQPQPGVGTALGFSLARSAG